MVGISARLWWVICALILVGCPSPPREDRAAEPREPAEPEQVEAQEETEDGPRPRNDVGAQAPLPLRIEAAVLPGEERLDHDALLTTLRTAAARDFRPVGHTSVAFRVRLDAPHLAAFRPRTREHRRGHLAEIAAYAIGRLIGLDNVVPCTLRFEGRRRMSERVNERFDGQWDEYDERIFYLSRRETPLASSYWVPDLHDTNLDDAEDEWGEWLRSGAIPESRVALARDLSNLRVFDYLIGNWDRFSGGNLKLFGGPVERVALRDHNVAFGRLAPGRERELREAVVRTHRFSRGVIQRLARLDELALREGISALNDAELLTKLRLPVLTEDEVAAVLDRAQVVLSHVGARVEASDEATVFYFD